jgi:hypothetical protein
MKFIREIIAEKTNKPGASDQLLCEDGADGPAVADENVDPTEEIDPVHRVASGGRSLGLADQFAYQTDNLMEDSEEPQDALDQAGGQGHSDMADDAEDDDGFDLVNGTSQDFEPSQAELTEPLEDPEPSELFANIWEQDETQSDIHEDDIFEDDAPEQDMIEAPASESGPPETESNAEALMRTMYPANRETTGQSEPQAAPPTEETEAAPAPEQEEAPAISAFHRIRRRQAALPEEPETAAEPETVPDPEPIPQVVPEPTAPIAVPAPAAGRARRQAGRVKTRLLGFGNEASSEADPFAADGNADPATQTMFPVGWMVVVAGPGRGTAFTLLTGVSQIGRGEGQAVRLDFGDNSISRENHAAVAYDPEQQAFFLGHGGKTNLVRLDGMPVLSTEPLNSGALIRIGETTLRFVALCGTEFDWDKTKDGEVGNARLG